MLLLLRAGPMEVGLLLEPGSVKVSMFVCPVAMGLLLQMCPMNVSRLVRLLRVRGSGGGPRGRQSDSPEQCDQQYASYNDSLHRRYPFSLPGVNRGARLHTASRCRPVGLSYPDPHPSNEHQPARLLACSARRRFSRTPKRVRRLLRTLGLSALGRPARDELGGVGSRGLSVFAARVAIDCVNQVWSTDIIYIHLRHGLVYLATVLGWHSRYVLGSIFLVLFSALLALMATFTASSIGSLNGTSIRSKPCS